MPITSKTVGGSLRSSIWGFSCTDRTSSRGPSTEVVPCSCHDSSQPDVEMRCHIVGELCWRRSRGALGLRWKELIELLPFRCFPSATSGHSHKLLDFREGNLEDNSEILLPLISSMNSSSDNISARFSSSRSSRICAAYLHGMVFSTSYKKSKARLLPEFTGCCCCCCCWEGEINLIVRSKPESTSLPKQWSQLATKVKGHDPVGGSNQLSSDEHDRHRGVAAEQLDQCLLHLSPSRVFVELVNRRIDSQLAEEPLDGVAHAAGAQAEDYHGLLRGQPHHPVHPRIEWNAGAQILVD
ncbi:Glutaredoxin [Musa troglodytarum]|uniref:Glutaredoxin n=1 Tax=Musa troglodytarum TaxID=320322 RepID=A0A9E7K6Z3_9LILI|nr:Glutaredoxin [Musa troglodytarum]